MGQKGAEANGLPEFILTNDFLCWRQRKLMQIETETGCV